MNTPKDALVISAWARNHRGHRLQDPARAQGAAMAADVRHRRSALAAAYRDRIIHGDKIDVWYDPADPSQAVNGPGRRSGAL